MANRMQCGRFQLDCSAPLIMGIVNATPDSFSDGGQYDPYEQILRLLEEGADLIDIGAESTRPGAAPVSEQEELDRLLPLLERVGSLPIPISIDTMKPTVMQAVLEWGVDMINDVNALQSAQAIAVLQRFPHAGICLMHMQGQPRTMQQDITDYQPNVWTAVQQFLAQRLDVLEQAGIERQRIVVDPGFGFGKTLEHNYQLLHHLSALQTLDRPILLGISRKSMIGGIIHQDAQHRLYGSIAATLAGVSRGATMIRTHDVKATREAIQIWQRVEQG